MIRADIDGISERRALKYYFLALFIQKINKYKITICR